LPAQPRSRDERRNRIRILLARHGQSEWNAIRRFQGSSDVGLSALGRRQAEALACAVRARQLVAVYSSPLRRAVETAAPAVAGGALELTIVPELAELGLGDWEGRTVDEVQALEGDPYRRWLAAPLDCAPPGSESLLGVCDRVQAAIERIRLAHAREQEGDVLVVAHGGVISTYACHLLGLSLNALWRLRVDNASITTVAPPRVISLNDTSHLT
jgi:alpha-ribazole phosphatase/probable phosphoglycerate mutase